MYTRILHGVVHGRTIELESDPGIDGREVEVVIRCPSPIDSDQSSAEPLPESAAGMLAEHWTNEDDEILAEIEQNRKRDQRDGLPK